MPVVEIIEADLNVKQHQQAGRSFIQSRSEDDEKVHESMSKQ